MPKIRDEAVNEQTRRAVLEELRSLEERTSDRSSDLTDEQIEALAVRAGREINPAVCDRWLAGSASDHPDGT